MSGEQDRRVAELGCRRNGPVQSGSKWGTYDFLGETVFRDLRHMSRRTGGLSKETPSNAGTLKPAASMTKAAPTTKERT